MATKARKDLQVFWGRLIVCPQVAVTLLIPNDDGNFAPVDVTIGESVVTTEVQLYNNQLVSILGTMGERTVPPGSTIPSLILESVALHSVIAQRAYDIYRLGAGRTAVDDWLRAERELLGVVTG